MRHRPTAQSCQIGDRRVKPEEQQKSETITDSEWIYKGRAIQLRVDTFECRGQKKTTELVHHPGAVVIFAVDDKKRVLLIRQWRRAIGKIILELPAGTLDKDEEPIVCAQRELQEETGYKGVLKPRGGFYCAPGYCDEYLYLFYADQLEKAPLPQDDDEGIELVPTKIEDALKFVEQGIIIDAKSIIGVLRCARS